MARGNWLASQSMKPASEQHPLFALLEYAGDEDGIEAFLDGLEATSSQALPGVGSRASRLTGSDQADYWAAVDELSVLCRLRTFGLDAILAEVPDIIVEPQADRLNLELTAPERTAALESLISRLVDALATNHHVTLNLGRVTWRPTSREQDEVVRRVLVACKSGDEGIDLADQVRSTSLTVTTRPSDAPAVGTATDADFGGYNPIPDLEATLDRKRFQLKQLPHVVVGVNLDRVAFDGVSWALRSQLRGAFGSPDQALLHAADNVVGVVWFCRWKPCDPPLLAGWVANVDYEGPQPPQLPRVLECLQVKGVAEGPI